MKKGDMIEGVIEDYSFPNRGSFLYKEMGQSGEERVYRVSVKGALPGQKVAASVKKKREGRAEAILRDVLLKSPRETRKPMCHHFYECGGCSYQTLAYRDQLALKESMIKNLLREVVSFPGDETLSEVKDQLNENNQSALKSEFGGDSQSGETAMSGGKPVMQWEGILASPSQFRYRNKMEFTFGDAEKDGPLTLGLHRRNSTHDIISVDSCAIVDPAWNEILKYTQKFFRKLGVPYYHKMRHEGVLRNLVLRESASDGKILVNLVTTTHYHIDENTRNIPWNEKRSETVADLHLPEYVAGLLSLGDGTGRFQSLSSYSRIAGVLYTECDTLADAIIPDSVTLLYGDDFLTEDVLGLKFSISPFSFFQTNTRGAEVLYGKVREYALESVDEISALPVIYDLYSGTGTIAQLMSPVAKKVYGIEIIEEAVEAARRNAGLNKLKNCEFIAGDVLKKLEELPEKPDLIILDPPRDGVNPKALRKILDYGVRNIIYVSCKPTSLVRDLAIMQEAGYRAVKGCCCDMFPNTLHVETVVLLGWKNIDEYIYFDYEPDHHIKTRGKATYREITDYIKNKYGVHVTNLNIAQVKDKCGFEKRENYNKGEEGHRVPNCTSEKEEMIMEAFKHFNML